MFHQLTSRGSGQASFEGKDEAGDDAEETHSVRRWCASVAKLIVRLSTDLESVLTRVVL